ncbi:MAG: serine hydrolase domain-containing protein [Panacagrimonas sp.]
MMFVCRPNRVRIPLDLGPVTVRDDASECALADTDLSAKALDEIWAATQALYRSGYHPMVSIALRRRGKLVLNRSLGHRIGAGPDERDAAELANPDTPVCLFSASKAISAMLAHKLVENGVIRLEDRVADYIPEYGVNGKHLTTVRELLAHRAGIPRIPMKRPDPEILFDWDGAVRLLAQAKPLMPTGTSQAYHAITAGYVIGELVRRASGRELRPLLRQWIAEPLGCRFMDFGIAQEHRGLVAHNAFTGRRPGLVLNTAARRVLGIEFERVAELSNADGFHNAIIPAGNIYASADEMCRFYQMMLDGGRWGERQLFTPETIAQATRPFGRLRIDRSLMLPMRFSAGFMLGESPIGMYGPNCPQAFGHLGFMSIYGWADPARDISVSILTTGKSVAIGSLVPVMRLLSAINRSCTPVA